MTLALRAHHLLCLLTYSGAGYSPEFVRNFDRVAARLAAGAAVTLVDGPDSVCAPLCCGPDGDHAHCHQPSVSVRDARAARELAPLLGQPLHAGSRLQLTPALLARLRAAFAREQIRSACTGCEWAELCTDIAAGGFEGVRLQAPTPQPAAHPMQQTDAPRHV